jgi:hypothetical protein
MVCAALIARNDMMRLHEVRAAATALRKNGCGIESNRQAPARCDESAQSDRGPPSVGALASGSSWGRLLGSRSADLFEGCVRCRRGLHEVV